MSTFFQLEKVSELASANDFEAYQWARVRELINKDSETLKVITDWATAHKLKLPIYERDRHPEHYQPAPHKLIYLPHL
jgi:hypothetical protein